MPEQWMIEAAQALIRGAAQTEDMAAKGAMLQTAADIMGRMTEQPAEQADAYEDE